MSAAVEALAREIDRLTPAERDELVRYVLTHDGNAAPAAKSDAAIVSMQKEAMRKLIERIQALPSEGPDDGFSGRDHDAVLYGHGYGS